MGGGTRHAVEMGLSDATRQDSRQVTPIDDKLMSDSAINVVLFVAPYSCRLMSAQVELGARLKQCVRGNVHVPLVSLISKVNRPGKMPTTVSANTSARQHYPPRFSRML
jgi:hypothetical protein